MTLSCKACALSRICLPANLTSDEIEQIEDNIVSSAKIKKGKTLYTAGEAFSGLYAIKSGSFKSVTTTSEGDAQIVGFHTPGEMMGFDGFDSNHACSAIALENSLVCKLTEKKLNRLYASFEGVTKHIHAMVASNVHTYHSNLLLIAQKTAEERIICFLKNISDRYRKRGFSGTAFSLSMPRGDIANYLGMAPETISRILAQLQDEGIVEFERREVRINNYNEFSRRSCGQTGMLANG